MARTVLPLEELRERVGAVPDPELPVVTIAGLGILRDVELRGDGVAEVTITPTYLGCPAMEVITAEVETAVREAGYAPVVTVRRNPSWTTDWITPAARAALHAHGIAPPSGDRAAGPVPVSIASHRTVAGGHDDATPACPHCGSTDTEELSRFSATACTALWRCRACREPFDRIKPI